MMAGLTVAIMQPYFFPYLGYFQLAAEADVFVFHDDVQYIKGGWVNRNLILKDGHPSWLTLPVHRAAHDLAIKARRYQLEPFVVSRVLRRIDAAYADAPNFESTYAVVRDIMTCGDANVATFNARLIRSIAGRLGIQTTFAVSSDMQKDDRLKGQERVIDMCRRLGATRYVNPAGGRHLYRRDHFERVGIDLRFVESTVATDPRFESGTLPPLSILDTLMHNDDESVSRMLKKRRVVTSIDPE